MVEAMISIMVYIFKTTVKTRNAVKKIASSLERLSFISKWNFDLQDCDHILRIESNEFDSSAVCALLNSFGFDCTEL